MLLIPFIAFAGDFSAQVNRNPTNMGEGFTLSLTLANNAPKGAPSLEALRELFIIHSQQQSYSTIMQNGKTTTSTIWHLTLIPQKSGKLIIPSINIATDKGILSTEPIALQVLTGRTEEEQDVSLVTTASSHKPYKNETILYTVRLVSPHNLNNISLETVTVEDAIVELAEKPKIEKETINGVKKSIVEFNYLITPIKPGTMIIPAFALQGEIPLRSKGGHRDLFSMIQGFDEVKPFVLNTDRIQMEVVPPEDGITPWLPAESIVIKEDLSSGPMQAFEPITRNFEMHGEGVLATQLPDLTDQQTTKSFRTYSDKPELKNEFHNGKILSTRKESYTLIPQSAGDLILPGISIEWWDVKNNKKIITSIAPRSVHVLPSARVSTPQVPEAVQVAPAPIEPPNPVLYIVIGVLGTLLFITVVGLAMMSRQIARMKAPLVKKVVAPVVVVQPPKVKKDKKEKLPDLNPT